MRALLCLFIPAVFAASDASQQLQRLPLTFEANRGQFAQQVEYFARGANYSLALTAREAWFTPAKSKSAIRMSLIGAGAIVRHEPLHLQSGQSNYLLASHQHTNIPHFAKVAWQNVYPGTDLVFYGKQRQLEYDFVLQPGADPSRIRLKFDGATRISLSPAGDLVLETPEGQIRQPKPVSYQTPGQYIETNYVLDKNEVTFRLAPYDKSRPLVIDPVLTYASYLGGTNSDEAHGIAVDANGYTYVTGHSKSVDSFPLLSPISPTFPSGTYAFVTKISPAGSLVYSTLYGCGATYARSIGVDPNGNAYITGGVVCANLPGPNPNSWSDGGLFIAKLNTLGNAIVYSARIGGSQTDQGNALHVTADGTVHVAGSSNSSNFRSIRSNQNLNTPLQKAVYITVTPTGEIYSSHRFGGNGTEFASGIVATPGNGVWLTGTTTSTTICGASNPNAGAQDAFLCRIQFLEKPAFGSGVKAWSTTGRLIGGTGADHGRAIATDSLGTLFVAGDTLSTTLPSAINSAGGSPDGFIAKFSSIGQLQTTRFLGGTGTDTALGVAVTSSGTIVVAGATSSYLFPHWFALANLPYKVPYVIRLTSTLAQVPFVGATPSSFVLYSQTNTATCANPDPGTQGREVTEIALDAAGNAHVVGFITCLSLPFANGFQPNYGGGNVDGFVFKVTP